MEIIRSHKAANRGKVLLRVCCLRKISKQFAAFDFHSLCNYAGFDCMAGKINGEYCRKAAKKGE